MSALEFSVGAKPEPLWAFLHIVYFWQLDSRLGSKQYRVLIGLFYAVVAESSDHHTGGVGSLCAQQLKVDSGTHRRSVHFSFQNFL